ncbi:hypothetical protein [Reyranella sp.]|uniref:hypothetical protein n=1 Tax=Reyranella sp. TaxID=1929291 RepID=UPI003D0EF45B
MRVILHVGMGKAGSSTLQATFAQQRGLLRESGYLYAEIGRANELTHNPLVMCFQEQRPRIFAQEKFDAAAYLKRLADTAKQSDAATMILSSEFLFYMNRASLEKLKTFLADCFSDIQVVAYLREPVSYYLSLQQQIVKASAQIISPFNSSSAMKGGVERYQAVFGSAFSAHDVSRSSLVKNCVAQDFRTRYLRDVKEDAFVTVTKNESLSAEAMCILQALHQNGFTGPDNVFTDAKHEIMKELRKAQRKLAIVGKPSLKSDIEAGLSSKFRDEVQWVNDATGLSLKVGVERKEPTPEHWKSERLRDLLAVTDSQIDRLNSQLIAQLWGNRIPKPPRKRPQLIE